MRLYFDGNASTPLDPRVLECYVTALKTAWANPSSFHQEGQEARACLVEARERCARLFSVLPRQILFFSSATEALNTTLASLAQQQKSGFLTTDVEHSSIYEPLMAWKDKGVPVEFLSVGSKGSMILDQLDQKKAVGSVVTSLANNETGVIVDGEALSRYTSERSLSLLLDAVAAIGKMTLPSLHGRYAMVIGSHKIYAPKGVGMAVLSKDFVIDPLLRGGKQESGRRAGTENVPALVAFSKALEFLFAEQQESIDRQKRLRDTLEREILSSIPHVFINGEGERVCNVSNLFIDGVEAEELIMLLDQQGVAISAGSACSSGALEPSRVITRMYSQPRALSSVRISLHKFTTEHEIELLISFLKKSVIKLRR